MWKLRAALPSIPTPGEERGFLTPSLSLSPSSFSLALFGFVFVVLCCFFLPPSQIESGKLSAPGLGF